MRRFCRRVYTCLCRSWRSLDSLRPRGLSARRQDRQEEDLRDQFLEAQRLLQHGRDAERLGPRGVVGVRRTRYENDPRRYRPGGSVVRRRDRRGSACAGRGERGPAGAPSRATPPPRRSGRSRRRRADPTPRPPPSAPRQRDGRRRRVRRVPAAPRGFCGRGATGAHGGRLLALDGCSRPGGEALLGYTRPRGAGGCGYRPGAPGHGLVGNICPLIHVYRAGGLEAR